MFLSQQDHFPFDIKAGVGLGAPEQTDDFRRGDLRILPQKLSNAFFKGLKTWLVGHGFLN